MRPVPALPILEPTSNVTLCCLTGLKPFQMGHSIDAFAALFLLDHPDIVNRKSRRFSDFLKKTASSSLFARPKTRPTYVAYLEYHPPMPYVLQSSYEDVEAELNVLRNRHLDKLILFVGGDGLSINRVILTTCSTFTPTLTLIVAL